MATPKRMKLCRPLPPELLSEMHKCLKIGQQIELIGNVPSRVIVLNNAKRVRRTLQQIKKALISMLNPEPPNQPKDWHVSITLGLRNHLIEKLAKAALYPFQKPGDFIANFGIKDLLLRFATVREMRIVEKECFEVASEKEAYYHMLAEKIYKIQKETGAGPKMISF